MKINLCLMPVLATLLVTVYCIPMQLQYFDNGLALRARRSSNRLIHDHRLNPKLRCKTHGASSGYVRNAEVPTEVAQENPSVLIQEGPIQETPVQENQVPNLDDATQVADQKPNATPEIDEDDESDDWPMSGPKNKNHPHYNFFPIMFGGHGGRTGGIPSGATAIANSFSTGKKGIANSHATAFGGDPSLLNNADSTENEQPAQKPSRMYYY